MDRDKYVEQLKKQLDEWNEKMAELEKEMWEAGEDSKERYREYLNELKIQQQQAQDQLRRLQHASESAWEDVLEGTKRAWREYEASLEKAWERFKAKDE